MSDDEGSLSTIVPGDHHGNSTISGAPSRRSSYNSRRSLSRGARSRSQSQDGKLGLFAEEPDGERPKFEHKSSIMSLMTDDEEEETGIPSARKAQPVVETETVASVPFLGVSQQPGSIRVKKSTDQMGSGSSLAGSRAPSRARRKRLAAASRADIFAAKIASAMDDASDSDETFVYDTNNTVRRPYALRTSSTLSLPVSPAVKSQRTNPSLYVQTVNSLSQSNTAQPSPSSGSAKREELRGRRRPAFLDEVQRRPSIPQKTDSMRAKHVYLNRWRGGELEDEDEDDGPLIDEQTPLSRSTTTQTPHDYASNRQSAPLYIRVTLWFVGLAMCCMFCTFVVGVLVASSRPLVGVEIARLVDVFPSDRELVLSLIVQAKNPGCFTVSASQVDLDLFATTAYAFDVAEASKRTLLLGNVQELESPLTFAGSFFNPKHTFSISTLRLVSPCENATETWQKISGNTFELTVRGVIKYSLLFSQDLRTSVSSSIVVRGPEVDGLNGA